MRKEWVLAASSIFAAHGLHAQIPSTTDSAAIFSIIGRAIGEHVRQHFDVGSAVVVESPLPYEHKIPFGKGIRVRPVGAAQRAKNMKALAHAAGLTSRPIPPEQAADFLRVLVMGPHFSSVGDTAQVIVQIWQKVGAGGSQGTSELKFVLIKDGSGWRIVHREGYVN